MDIKLRWKKFNYLYILEIDNLRNYSGIIFEGTIPMGLLVAEDIPPQHPYF